MQTYPEVQERDPGDNRLDGSVIQKRASTEARTPLDLHPSQGGSFHDRGLLDPLHATAGDLDEMAGRMRHSIQRRPLTRLGGGS